MSYELVKNWRNKPKNRKYAARYMRERRIYYKTLWKDGKIEYDDIPKAYRYWVNPSPKE